MNGQRKLANTQPSSPGVPEDLIIRNVIFHEMSVAVKYLFFNTFPCRPLHNSFQVNGCILTMHTCLEIRFNDNQWNKLHIDIFKTGITCTQLKHVTDRSMYEYLANVLKIKEYLSLMFTWHVSECPIWYILKQLEKHVAYFICLFEGIVMEYKTTPWKILAPQIHYEQ